MSTTPFAERILHWFESNGRKDLPWQQNTTPYRVWVSEIMLQQTQVATVIPYYERFMKSFPDVDALASADIDAVLHHWSGLGYYARARNLHKAAQHIRDEYRGTFPTAFEDVLALPGIGRSTAGAILALSRNERHAILDGNVKRVLARYHTIGGWPGNASVADELWQVAESHLPENNIADYTQAMMDLGATICRRSRPLCGNCPLTGDCKAYKDDAVANFPGKRAKKAKPQKTSHMLLLRSGTAIYLERRPAAGIWGGLWSFPELSGDTQVAEWCEQRLNVRPTAVEKWATVRHSFTHFDLDIEPIAVRVEKDSAKVADDNDHIWYDTAAPQKLGIAAPVMILIQKLKELNENVPNR